MVNGKRRAEESIHFSIVNAGITFCHIMHTAAYSSISKSSCIYVVSIKIPKCVSRIFSHFVASHVSCTVHQQQQLKMKTGGKK